MDWWPRVKIGVLSCDSRLVQGETTKLLFDDGIEKRLAKV